MKWKRRMGGSVVVFIGFLLSPLSWWNDLFVNVPLAVGFGWLVGLIHRSLFEPAVVVGYWLTNVLGFLLLHLGARTAVADGSPRPYTRKAVMGDLLISLAYTAVVLVLVRFGVIRPIGP
jgi:hypothetical protein